tara:strand:+ start:1877 stop:2083 length:207 start_codon:yes stop_codon:yes gene_type:complete
MRRFSIENRIEAIRFDLAFIGFIDSVSILSDKELVSLFKLGLSNCKVVGVYSDLYSGFTLAESIDANK